MLAMSARLSLMWPEAPMSLNTLFLSLFWPRCICNQHLELECLIYSLFMATGALLRSHAQGVHGALQDMPGARVRLTLFIVR